jgi:ABC-type transport system involved in multi-copper enzyme maturation permease subunit
MIGVGAASGIYAGLTWKRLKRGRLLWVCGVLLLLPVVGAGALAAAGHWGRSLFDEVLELYFRFLVPFVPALLASPVIAEEIENKTFTFAFARPAPRSALVLGKYVAVVVPAALATMVSIALVWLLAMLRFPEDMGGNLPHLAQAELAAVIGTFAFAALASALGSLFTKHPFAGVIGYLLIIEAGLGSAPIVLNLLSMSWHLRNLADLPLAEVSFMALHVPGWVSALIVGVVSTTCLGGAALAVSGSEYNGR